MLKPREDFSFLCVLIPNLKETIIFTNTYVLSTF